MAALSLVVASALGMSACGAASPAGHPGASVVAPPVTSVRWSACAGGFDCGSLRVPLDYGTPQGATLPLAVVKRPADLPGARDGVLVIDFGGPALSGVAALRLSAGLLPADLRRHFDLVSFDPRGSGNSARLGCGTDVGAFVGAPPLAAAGAELPAATPGRALIGECRRVDAALFRSISSTNEARDLERLRTALGAEQIRYLGLSYGTVLGLAYLDRYPTRVAAMVLDSPLNPAEPLADLAAEQAAAADAALGRQLPGVLAARYDTAHRELRRAPLPAPGAGDNTPVSEADLQLATLTYLQAPALASDYPAALSAAAAGNGAPLRDLAATEYQDLDGTSVLGAYWATVCDDMAERPSPVAANTAGRQLAADYPHLGAIAPAFAGGPCTVWPAAAEPVTLPAGPAPVLIVAGTADPITPYATAVGLAHALPWTQLLTRVGEGHTTLLTGSTHCLDDLARFLTNPSPHPSNPTCPDPAAAAS